MLRREKSIKTALFTFVLLLAGVAVAQTPGQVPQGANIPRNMKPYFLCLLEKGEKWTPVQFADPAMQEHLAYIREEVEAGKYVVVGPVLDQGRIGGVAIMHASSIEEGQKNLNKDNVVRSRRDTAEIHSVMVAYLSALR